jgi:hypothetical protein
MGVKIYVYDDLPSHRLRANRSQQHCSIARSVKDSR